MTDSQSPGGGPASPTFSLIVPVYNVEAFMPDFLGSLERQAGGLADCELIFVNDGSTDASAETVRAWLERGGAAGQVIDQANQGLAPARNAGLARATGAWVTFPDPDDILDDAYLESVRRFLAGTRVPVDLLCTRLVMLDGVTGEISDTHPLHRRFDGGTRLVHLLQSPDVIHLSAATAFYQRARLEELGLRFDAEIRPNFEDGSLTTRYLLDSADPRLGLIADARYLYRKRADQSSLVQSSWLSAEKYTTVPDRGYLALLTYAAERGEVPTWVQNLILYDLLFYFRADQSTDSSTGLAQPEWTDRFHELTGAILEQIDLETIDGFGVIPTSRQLKEALIIGYKGEHLRPAAIALEKLDADQRLVQLRYFFGGQAPFEEIWLDGRPARPAYAKTRDITYLKRVLLHERIAWLPADAEIAISLDGRRVPLLFGAPPNPVYAAKPSQTWNRLGAGRRGPSSRQGEAGWAASATRRVKTAVRARFPDTVRRLRVARRSLLGKPAPTPRSTPAQYQTSPFINLDRVLDAAIVRRASSRAVRRRYESAWTFMDRDTEAHDNAEHLYRYVRRHRPDLNAWFVLRRDSADWDRLASEGFRLVAFGTPDHAELLINTAYLVSSQVDNYVVRPLDPKRFGAPSWRFTFLQHGVTKDDLSRWLNGKPIDRFVTASPSEHASIVGYGSPYVFTEKEVRLTGFPRHDRLLDLRRRVTRPDLILIMPTWRRWLLARATDGNARGLREPLASTAFGRSWFDLAGSPELRAIADDAGCEVVFVPHPNMEAHIERDDLPDWVRVRGYQTSDVQELLARAAITVSDYSSQAFEAAYLECPVVYYQFDHDAFFSGSHVYRKGKWDYVADGFGPVTETGEDALAAIRAAVEAVRPVEPYATRMRAAFPYRDGGCCKRTLDSILSLTAPVDPDDAVNFIAEEPQPSGRDGGQPVDSLADPDQVRG